MTRRAANPGQRPFLVSGDSMKRIAAAVQSYEHGNRSQSPVRFRHVGDDGGGGGSLKLCKTSGEWGLDQIATLNVWHGGGPGSETESGETVEAVNKMVPVGADAFVIVGKAGNGSWYLVEAGPDCGKDGRLAQRVADDGLDDSIAVDALALGEGGPQVLVHDKGCLLWASLSKVTVIVGADLTEDGLVFETQEIWTFPDSESSPGEVTINTTECPPPE